MITSIKSSIGIITHQGHISKVNENAYSVTQWVSEWLSSLLERLVALKTETFWFNAWLAELLKNKLRRIRKLSLWKHTSLNIKMLVIQKYTFRNYCSFILQLKVVPKSGSLYKWDYTLLTVHKWGFINISYSFIYTNFI